MLQALLAPDTNSYLEHTVRTLEVAASNAGGSAADELQAIARSVKKNQFKMQLAGGEFVPVPLTVSIMRSLLWRLNLPM